MKNNSLARIFCGLIYGGAVAEEILSLGSDWGQVECRIAPIGSNSRQFRDFLIRLKRATNPLEDRSRF
jgi:hypothetical protein